MPRSLRVLLERSAKTRRPVRALCARRRARVAAPAAPRSQRGRDSTRGMSGPPGAGLTQGHHTAPSPGATSPLLHSLTLSGMAEAEEDTR